MADFQNARVINLQMETWEFSNGEDRTRLAGSGVEFYRLMQLPDGLAQQIFSFSSHYGQRGWDSFEKNTWLWLPTEAIYSLHVLLWCRSKDGFQKLSFFFHYFLLANWRASEKMFSFWKEVDHFVEEAWLRVGTFSFPSRKSRKWKLIARELIFSLKYFPGKPFPCTEKRLWLIKKKILK